jgi:hypothetical protein
MLEKIQVTCCTWLYLCLASHVKPHFLLLLLLLLLNKAVSLDDLHRVLNKHLAPLFDSAQVTHHLALGLHSLDGWHDWLADSWPSSSTHTVQTNISITTNPSNTDEIREFFETKLGKKVNLVTSVEEHYAA